MKSCHRLALPSSVSPFFQFSSPMAWNVNSKLCSSKAESSPQSTIDRKLAKNSPEVVILRLGHRLVRDARMSTHIGLVSRAFGARSLFVTGADDETVDSLRKLTKNWGGEFEVSYVKNWREFVRKWDGKVAHLTMYGEHLDDIIPRIRGDLESASEKKRKLLVVIGAEKVPGDVYKLADYNVAVGNQPHSEIAALAVFLDRLFMGGELYYLFENARIRVFPNPHGKEVERLLT